MERLSAAVGAGIPERHEARHSTGVTGLVASGPVAPLPRYSLTIAYTSRSNVRPSLVAAFRSRASHT